MTIMPDLTMTPTELYEKSVQIGYDKALVDISEVLVAAVGNKAKTEAVYEFLFNQLQKDEK